MRLHFPSVAVGIAGLSIVLISMSQATAPVNSIRVEYGPQPRDMVQIREGTPYVVPAGRVFVLTGLGVNEYIGGMATLRVNGQPDAVAGLGGIGGPQVGPVSASSVAAVPTGFSAVAGTIIEPVAGNGRGRAWGYLGNP